MTPEHAQYPRPQSEILTDLHLYVIPADSWRQDLQSALNEVTSQSVSLGFVRVNPDSRLADLREEMAAQLDASQLPDGFAFLRSVGRCFAKVTKKQESKLKIKYFTPPYAPSHEIFLLPSTAGEDDAASSSDTLSLRADSLASLQSLRLMAPVPATSSAPSPLPQHHDKPASLPTATTTNEASARNPKHHTQTPKRGPSRAGTVTPSSGRLERKSVAGGNNEQQLQQQQQQLQQQQQHPSVAEARQPADSSRSSGRSDDHGRAAGGEPAAGDAVAEPQVNSSTVALADLAGKELSDEASLSKADAKVDEIQAPLDVALTMRQLTAARQTRLEAERKRADIIKKVKLLQAKTDSRRIQAKEMWKRKYFEEKQKTPSLEESCDSLKVLIATVRQKSLQRAAGSKGVSNGVAPTADQAADEQHAAAAKLEYDIQDLRYQVERASMQVSAELKLRTQAETELRVLRAELVQHKLNAGGALPD